MDFSYSEEQREIQELARRILTDIATPDRIRQLENSKLRYDSALWEKLAEAGLLGVAVDTDHGGMGFGFTELCLLAEEVGRTVAPVPVLPVLVTALAVQEFGTPAQRQALLPGIASGELLVSSALMEPQAEDPAAPGHTTAQPGEGGWVLRGMKGCVPYAEQAGRLLVSARTPEGVVVLLVDPNATGISLRPLRVTTYEPQCDVVFNDVRVAATDVLAGPAEGAAVMAWLCERMQAALCAMQLGVTHKMLSMTASYTSERQQFGVPVATFQAVGHRAANGYIDVECLRLTTQQAVSLLSDGHAAANEVLIAKVWAGDVGHRVSYSAQHLHGGMGVDRDYPLWRYCLWAKQIELSLGGSMPLLATLGNRIAAGGGMVQ